MLTTFTLPIVGANFRKPAPLIFKALVVGHPLLLEPEPTNQYDRYAVKVLLSISTLTESMIEELTDTLPTQGYTIEQLLALPVLHLGYIASNQPKGESWPILAPDLAGQWPEQEEDSPVYTEGTLVFSDYGKPAIQFALDYVERDEDVHDEGDGDGDE